MLVSLCLYWFCLFVVVLCSGLLGLVFLWGCGPVLCLGCVFFLCRLGRWRVCGCVVYFRGSACLWRVCVGLCRSNLIFSVSFFGLFVGEP